MRSVLSILVQAQAFVCAIVAGNCVLVRDPHSDSRETSQFYKPTKPPHVSPPNPVRASLDGIIAINGDFFRFSQHICLSSDS